MWLAEFWSREAWYSDVAFDEEAVQLQYKKYE
jgi:hypothetical protein